MGFGAKTHWVCNPFRSHHLGMMDIYLVPVMLVEWDIGPDRNWNLCGSCQMAITKKQEARALSSDEQELVNKSHHPDVQHVSDEELRNLVKLVRERRDRARTEASRRRREMRGKASPKGATASRAEDGSKLKLAVLAMAMRRLNSEQERRLKMASRLALVENAHKALELKNQSADARVVPLNSRHAHEGMRSKPSSRRQNLIRPMELGRLRQAAKVAQAKRDNR
jgi:hypothetical protein